MALPQHPIPVVQPQSYSNKEPTSKQQENQEAEQQCLFKWRNNGVYSMAVAKQTRLPNSGT